MKNLTFWKSDWFLGLVVTLVLLVASGGDLIQSLERKAYDLGVKSASRTPSDRIAIIAIDDQSIANIGRWPWPRDVHAKMTDILANAKAKTIGYTAFFFEPQVDAGLAYINKLNEAYARRNSKVRTIPTPINSRRCSPRRPWPSIPISGSRRVSRNQTTFCCRWCSSSFPSSRRATLTNPCPPRCWRTVLR